MTLLGVDLSHHNPVNWSAFRTDFLIHKASEGDSFRDDMYGLRSQMARLRRIPFGAYHFLRADSPGIRQADHCYSIVGRNVPLMLDIETDSSGGHPTMDQSRAFTVRFRNLGGTVGLWYLPFWYWSGQWASRVLPPDAPPLVQSIYPAGNSPGTPASRYVAVGFDGAHAWAPMGGKPVVVWQYGSNGIVPGVSGSADMDAYRGSRAQLAREPFLTTWDTQPPPVQSGDDVTTVPEVRDIAWSAVRAGLTGHNNGDMPASVTGPDLQDISVPAQLTAMEARIMARLDQISPPTA